MVYINQTIKNRIYSLGTEKQLKFLSGKGGLTDEEYKLLILNHQNKPDSIIEDELCISKETRQEMEQLIKIKMAVAVFHCVDYTMEHED